MAMGSQQLTEDYEQLKELIELYPNITIVAAEGQPPDNYELEYHLRGFIKEESGTVAIGDSHKVRISLPFGYPHFAPIAKPLTSIFHPDIDPAAIRIADRWQQNPSLPDLVLLIGEMICGNIYSLEDPFNQDAADWYRNNQAKLPLDSLSLADIVESEEGFESLVDDTFASLGLETDEFLEPEASVSEEDIQRIRDLFAQNKVFTANKLLMDLPENAEFPDRDEVQQAIGKVLRKTDQLFKMAEQLEDIGKFGEAAEVVDNLLAIAADAPGAESLRDRVQQAFLLASRTQSASGPEGTSAVAKPGSGSKRSKQTLASEPAPTPSTAKEKFTLTLVNLHYKPILLTLLLLGIGLGTTSLYFRDQSIFNQSQATFLKSRTLVDKHEFENARQGLEAALDLLNQLTVLRFRKSGLEKNINEVLTSPTLQEGLQGRVLHGGTYTSVNQAAALNELAALNEKAQALVSQDKLSEALAIYRKALQHAEKNDLDSQKAAIKDYIRSVDLRDALARAEKAEKEKNWNAAAEAYRQALTLSGDLTDLGSASDITSRLTAAAFRHELDQSKKAFSQSQWQETITFLQQAQQALTANPDAVTAKERQDLHQLLVNAQLYRSLSVAREAYQQKHWPEAIGEYQNALDLLGREASGADNSLSESIAKVEKTLLMVKVAQLQEKVVLAENKNDLPSVVELSREILKLIRSSKHVGDQAVKTVIQKVTDQIEKNLEQIVKNERINWLETHFEEIFRANYPTFQGSKLLQPKAVFFKKVDNKIIFTLTCTERSQGSSSKLELNYMFDEGTGKWSAYSGK